MIGNDVIDLQQSRLESNWQRKGFLEKLFTDEEQQLIEEHHDPEIMVWLLWSMKEAAYKVYNRQTKIREYIPKKLACSIMTLYEFQAQGRVTCNGNTYYTKTQITPENIHTIAGVRMEILDNIKETDRKGIIKNETGIPYLAAIGAELQDISISHHGRFERIVTFTKKKSSPENKSI